MAYQCGRLFAQKQLSGSLFRGFLSSRTQLGTIRAAANAATKDNEDYDAKNARLGRPQSPHLTIYKLQLTSLLSVTHRATGMTMGGIVTMWGIGGLFMSGSFPQTIAALQDLHLSPALILAAKAVLVYPLCFHYANGIRHLAWDMGKFLTIKEVYLTGYTVLALSLVFTSILASM